MTTQKNPKITNSIRKPRAVKKIEGNAEITNTTGNPAFEAEKKINKQKDIYVFATGRRKTSVANIRLFHGMDKNLINKKPLETYFSFKYFRDFILRPLELTGNEKKKYFIANVSGGGLFSQAQALRHGLSIALSNESLDIRKILKKNGFLTRDDRKKERKKPGLKRARRAPQWAKR